MRNIIGQSWLPKTTMPWHQRIDAKALSFFLIVTDYGDACATERTDNIKG
jgi:hypothetical protein